MSRGGPKKLIYQEVDLPKLKPGWSLIKVKSFGINHSEIFTREGKSPSVSFPRILGIECVGIIEVSDKFPIGQKVVSIMGEMGRQFDGSYAQFTLLPNDQIYPVESNLNWTDLAAVPESYYTAYGSFLNLKIEENDKILVRGGTSGVGVAFVRIVLSKFKNVEVDGSTRDLTKASKMKIAGYHDVVLDKDGVLQTEKMYDKIFESIGPKTIKDSFTHLISGGIVCSTGQLGDQWVLEDFDPIVVLHNNTYLTTFSSGNVSQEKIQAMFQFIEEFQVNVSPEKIFKLHEVYLAHQYLQSSHSFGKVVVEVD